MRKYFLILLLLPALAYAEPHYYPQVFVDKYINGVAFSVHNRYPTDMLCYIDAKVFFKDGTEKTKKERVLITAGMMGGLNFVLIDEFNAIEGGEASTDCILYGPDE